MVRMPCPGVCGGVCRQTAGFRLPTSPSDVRGAGVLELVTSLLVTGAGPPVVL